MAMKKSLTISLNESDFALIEKARGTLSLAGYLLRCTMKVVAQEIYQTHYAPDHHERNKEVILRFLQNGCVSVEDIESHAFSLSATEIEGYLHELEMEGKIERQKAKRGRMWRWDVI